MQRKMQDVLREVAKYLSLRKFKALAECFKDQNLSLFNNPNDHIWQYFMEKHFNMQKKTLKRQFDELFVQEPDKNYAAIHNDMNCLHYSGTFPGIVLHQAATYGSNDVLEALIPDPDNNIDGLDYNGFTPLMMAVRFNNFTSNDEIVKILIKGGADLNKRGGDNEDTALVIAICNLGYRCNKSVIRILLDAGASMEVPNTQNRTALRILVSVVKKYNAYDILELLISRGANIDHQCDAKETALHAACEKEDCRAVKMLLDAGAKPDIQSSYGDLPMHFSCSLGDCESLRLLIDAGAPINSRNIKGKTPLMCAVSQNDPSCVKMLLDAGADRHIKSKKGLTAEMMITGEDEEMKAMAKLFESARRTTRQSTGSLPKKRSFMDMANIFGW